MKTNSDTRTKHPESPEAASAEERRFRLGRLMAWLVGAVMGLALIAALVDVLVLGW